MSKEKKSPPIQPAPLKPFTVRLVDGHFVRVPKLDQTAQTDATRPSADGGSAKVRVGAEHPPLMRLVNGKFERIGDQMADSGGASAFKPHTVSRSKSSVGATAKDGKPVKDTWDAAFNTEIDPADSSTKGQTRP